MIRLRSLSTYRIATRGPQSSDGHVVLCVTAGPEYAFAKVNPEGIFLQRRHRRGVKAAANRGPWQRSIAGAISVVPLPLWG